MSYQTAIPSNLSNSAQMVRPLIVPFLNSLVAREQGISRSKYFGSYDIDGYSSNINKYHIQNLEDTNQMQDHYSVPPQPTKPLQNLSKHLNIARVHEPNEIPQLYSKVYTSDKIIKANETGTYDRMRTSNFPARKYMVH